LINQLPSEDVGDIAQRASARQWYHTLELADGVVSPGWFDTRSVAAKLPMPKRLDGMRCLDIGTFDGFWAFEMERRGAREVVAVDILDEAKWDWPYEQSQIRRTAIEARKGGGDGFLIAKEALRSQVVRHDRSVYELSADEIGSFDFVYLGSILLHLRDPVKALERIRSVTAGLMLSVDAIDLGLTILHPRRPVSNLDGIGRPYWWKPNTAALRRMVTVAGFQIVEGPRVLFMPPGAGHPRPPLLRNVWRGIEAREVVWTARYGNPHASVLARPSAVGTGTT
jgi:tRNA (mo5U34)-methyltransferase